MKTRKLENVVATLVRCALFLGGLFLVAHPLRAQEPPATVILVRHSEKLAEPTADPPLSAAGIARTNRLLGVLREARVDVIYSTPRLRNLQTAQILADSLHVPVVKVEIAKLETYVHDIAELVKKDGGGRVSVVVGHSNTFGAVAKGLGASSVTDVADEQYDDLVVLTMQTGRRTKAIRAKF